MPQHLDERYLWDRGDLPIEPLVTPEQYRAVIRARSDDSAPVVAEGELTSGAASAQEENDGKESYLETLRGGEKDWAFFTSEVIDYYNQFLKGESFAGCSTQYLYYFRCMAGNVCSQVGQGWSWSKSNTKESL